jgi:hypothetical protein
LYDLSVLDDDPTYRRFKYKEYRLAAAWKTINMLKNSVRLWSFFSISQILSLTALSEHNELDSRDLIESSSSKYLFRNSPRATQT